MTRARQEQICPSDTPYYQQHYYQQQQQAEQARTPKKSATPEIADYA